MQRDATYTSDPFQIATRRVELLKHGDRSPADANSTPPTDRGLPGRGATGRRWHRVPAALMYETKPGRPREREREKNILFETSGTTTGET